MHPLDLLKVGDSNIFLVNVPYSLLDFLGVHLLKVFMDHHTFQFATRGQCIKGK